MKLGQVTSGIPEMTFSLDDWNKSSYLYYIIFNSCVYICQARDKRLKIEDIKH